MNTIAPISAATEITERNEHFFNAGVRPLYGIDGEPIDPQIARGVYRDDTNECIASCGPNFKPVQHHDIVQPIMQHFHGLGYEIEERAPNRRDLRDLVGRSGAFMQRKYAHNGAVMRTDIITGDFITPTGRTSYMQQGPDTMLFKTSILNSHNGSLAVRVITSYERIICMNGMTRPDFSAGVYGKHTSNFSLRAMTAQIENSLNGMYQDAETFGRWAKKKINREIAETMLQKTIAKQQARGNNPPYSERLIGLILDRFAHEDQTVWGLYQAVTWWQSHHKVSENASPLTTTINRETRVAKMLRSDEWNALTEDA
jgi:hypothetical protein